MLRRRLAAPLIALALMSAACSDDSSSSASTGADTTLGSTDDSTGDTGSDTTVDAATTTAEPAIPSTSVDVATLALAYSEYGQYPVGVTTLQLPDGTPVEVWYPAIDGSDGTEVFDMRDFIPEAIDALLVPDAPTTVSYSATRDAAVTDGSFPVVLFSHGAAGVRLQSTAITANLASWGTIVVAPEHPSRDLNAALSGATTGNRTDSVDDLLDSLDLITAANDDPTNLFAGHVDVDRVAALGHSAGGATVLLAADDPRVDGYVSMASGVLRGRSDEAEGTTTTIEVTMPNKPSFFIAGSADEMVPAATVTQPAFEAAPSPSLLWIIEGAGHAAFTDFCNLGNGQGIIGVAESSGLGDVIASFPQLRALGEDGCIPPAIDVAITFPIINHAVTAWMLHLFGIDEEPVGLGEEVAGSYDTPVTITTK